jgi:hypothetical protein
MAVQPNAEDINGQNDHAKMLLRLKATDQAKEILDDLVWTSRQTLGDDHPVTLRVMATFADSLLELGFPDAALQGHEMVLALREKALGDSHPETDESRRRVAELQQRP